VTYTNTLTSLDGWTDATTFKVIATYAEGTEFEARIEYPLYEVTFADYCAANVISYDFEMIETTNENEEENNVTTTLEFSHD